MIVAPHIVLRSASAMLAGREILSGIDLTAGTGEFIALVGPNGAGKSTLLKLIAGLIRPAGGDVLLDGKPVHDWSFSDRARQIAWLPQVRPVAWNLLSEDIVALGRYTSGTGVYAHLDMAGRTAVDQAMARMSAGHLKGRGAKTLSGGELARLHVARILASEARLLLLDEPAAALDIEHQIGLMDILSDEVAGGRSVIVAVHDLDLAARYCPRMLVLRNGKIIRDGPPQNALDEDMLAAVFHVRRDETGHLSRFSPEKSR